MAVIPTNKPHKNTEAEKCGSKGKSATNIFDFTSVCRASLIRLKKPNILPFKVKVEQTFERNNLNCVFKCKL